MIGDAAPRPTRVFRSAATPRLSDDQKRRQASLMTAAWRTFGDRERTIAFLNAHHDGLGGRPLDLAIGDDAGLATVVAHLDAAATRSTPIREG